MKLCHIYLSILTFLCAIYFIDSCMGQSSLMTSNEEDLLLKRKDKGAELDKLISTYADYNEFNGTVLVAEKGRIIYKRGFGFANMEWSVPNQTTTKFRIGSVTKQFTAMLVLQLVADKRIDLHVPISTYLPDYPKENGDKVTIDHLLTHSSGVPNSYESTKKKAIRPDNYSAEELVDEFSALPLEFDPGEKFVYSNAGYNLLGLLIEKVTQKRYEEVLKEKIFEPLEMFDSGVDKHRNLIIHRAEGYFKNWGDYYNANYLDPSVAFAAGALYSTVEDLYKWDQALYTERLLPKEYMDLIFTKHIVDAEEGGHYGYGWSIKKVPLGNSKDVVEIVGHDGVINGFCALFTRIPSSKSSVILLSNIRRAPLNAMTRGILGIMHDKSHDMPRKSLAYSLLETVENEGLRAAIKQFENHREDSSYYLSEQEMNIVSYKLLESDRAIEAAEILKLGIKAYPHAFNLYDSLGEVLRSLGRTQESIKNYKMSVKLNPMNENGIKMLNEMGFNLKIPTREELYFLEADDSWRKEMFYFPLDFANDISYLGIEDARFPNGWEEKDSSTYWTYVIGWNIDQTRALTKEELEADMKKYFDGLMGVVNKTGKDISDVTTVSFEEVIKAGQKAKFQGTINTYDSFLDNEMMTLHVSVDQKFCEKAQKLLVQFRLSKQDFEHKVWNILNEVKIKNDICKTYFK